MTNSGGLMYVGRWATVNDLVQKKIPFYNSSTEPAFTSLKLLTKAPDECARSVKS